MKKWPPGIVCVPIGHVGEQEVGYREQLRLQCLIHHAEVRVKRLHRIG